jgi:type II secretory pathway pseudopilin PulG
MRNPKSEIRNPKSNERGATLASMLALMTIMALFLLAVAPNVVQEVQREKELESIRRGEEIAEAIQLYAQATGKLPQSMDDLLEGISVAGRTKKTMILRKSAAKDPLSSSGEWKFVQSNDKLLVDFMRRVMNYNNGATPSTPNIRVLQAPLGQIISSLNTETTEDTDPPGGEDDSANIDAPFIGVVSRSQRKTVVTYYGIGRHDRWVFTPLFRGTNDAGGNNNFPPPPPPPPPPPE